MAFLGGLAACSDSTNAGTPQQDASSQRDSTAPQQDSGSTKADGAKADGAEAGPNSTYVLIDDMETTTHGPIELDARASTSPLTPGYWYNSGAQATVDGGGDAADTSDPPQVSFVFSALPTPTTTLNGKASTHAARQTCVLNGLYDTCGVGFEFAQVPVRRRGLRAAAGDAAPNDARVDGGAGATDGGASDAAVADSRAGDSATTGLGDAGPSIPLVTVPFDISRYKAITFWGMTTTPDPTTGSLQVKVQFPDTDTDPRGQICNGGGRNTSKCYNSYAAYLNFTTSWQQFTVLLDAGDGGVRPDGGIAIDTTWGYQEAQWIPTQVYGINWQAQRNTDAGRRPAPDDRHLGRRRVLRRVR